MVHALYRRYRPETFAELIGQSQVTDPLRHALTTDRVNHAYLFSGPIETLVDGAERLARELDLPSDFPAVFRSIRAKSPLAHPRLTGSEAYGLFPQARELVESRFHEEITIFGYVFPF